MKIAKTKHYVIYHEKNIPWDKVVQVVLTTKKEQIGKGFFRFVRGSKKKKIYVLGKFDSLKNILWIINAKESRR